MPTDLNAKAQRCKDARLKPILNPRKQAYPLVISAGGLFGLKISQFPCVFASLQCYVRKSFIFGTILRGHLRKLLETSVLGARPVTLCLRAKAGPFRDFTALRFSVFLCVLCVKNLSASIFLPALLLFPFGCGFAALCLCVKDF